MDKILFSLIGFTIILLASSLVVTGIVAGSDSDNKRLFTREPISPTTERDCQGDICQMRIYSAPIFTKEGGRYYGLGEVSDLKYDTRREVFYFSYREEIIYLRPFAIYNGNYINTTDMRRIGLTIEVQNNTERFNHKFSVDLIGSQTTINNLNNFGFDIIETRGISPRDIQNYSLGWVIKDHIKIDFTDWVESGFTIDFINSTRILAGNISANYENGMVSLDPTISLSGTSVTEDSSCGSSSCPVEFTFLDLDPLQSSPDRVMLKFNTSDLPSSYLVTYAELGLYQFVEALETGEEFNASVYYMINDSWNETSLTWLGQPCGAFFDNTSGCNLTPQYDITNFTDGINNLWRIWEVTDGINEDTNHSVGFVIKTPENDTTSGGTDLVRFWSSEYTGNSSLIPYLEITYENTACESDSVWNYPGWDYRKAINVTGVSSLSDYPYLVNVSKESAMQSDYDDLRIIDVACSSVVSGEEVFYEIENYTSDYAMLWVKIPSLVTGVNELCMYYGNSSATIGQNMTGAWDEAYEFVYHLNETTGIPNDSTINVRNGSCNNADCPTYNSTAIIDGGLEFEGVNIGLAPFGEFNWINVSDTIGLLQSGSKFTLEGWFMMASTTNDRGLITKWNGNGYMLFQHTSNEIRFYLSGTSIQSSGLEPNQIYYIVATWDNSGEFPVGNMSLYIDGALNVTGTDTSMGTNTLPLVLGTYNNRKQSVFNGTMDEIRISNDIRSADYINQTYQMRTYQDEFVVFGSEENPVPKWKYATNSTNSTNAGEYIQHIVCLTDDVLDDTIFSLDQGNGTFYNFTPEDISDNSSVWANTTALINSTVGTTIRWIYYFNDSIGQVNNTAIFVYVTLGGADCWTIAGNLLIVPNSCLYYQTSLGGIP